MVRSSQLDEAIDIPEDVDIEDVLSRLEGEGEEGRKRSKEEKKLLRKMRKKVRRHPTRVFRGPVRHFSFTLERYQEHLKNLSKALLKELQAYENAFDVRDYDEPYFNIVEAAKKALVGLVQFTFQLTKVRELYEKAIVKADFEWSGRIIYASTDETKQLVASIYIQGKLIEAQVGRKVMMFLANNFRKMRTRKRTVQRLKDLLVGAKSIVEDLVGSSGEAKLGGQLAKLDDMIEDLERYVKVRPTMRRRTREQGEKIRSLLVVVRRALPQLKARYIDQIFTDNLDSALEAIGDVATTHDSDVDELAEFAREHGVDPSVLRNMDNVLSFGEELPEAPTGAGVSEEDLREFQSQFQEVLRQRLLGGKLPLGERGIINEWKLFSGRKKFPPTYTLSTDQLRQLALFQDKLYSSEEVPPEEPKLTDEERSRIVEYYNTVLKPWFERSYAAGHPKITRKDIQSRWRTYCLDKGIRVIVPLRDEQIDSFLQAQNRIYKEPEEAIEEPLEGEGITEKDLKDFYVTYIDPVVNREYLLGRPKVTSSHMSEYWNDYAKKKGLPPAYVPSKEQLQLLLDAQDRTYSAEVSPTLEPYLKKFFVTELIPAVRQRMEAGEDVFPLQQVNVLFRIYLQREEPDRAPLTELPLAEQRLVQLVQRYAAERLAVPQKSEVETYLGITPRPEEDKRQALVATFLRDELLPWIQKKAEDLKTTVEFSKDLVDNLLSQMVTRIRATGVIIPDVELSPDEYEIAAQVIRYAQGQLAQEDHKKIQQLLGIREDSPVDEEAEELTQESLWDGFVRGVGSQEFADYIQQARKYNLEELRARLQRKEFPSDFEATLRGKWEELYSKTFGEQAPTPAFDRKPFVAMWERLAEEEAKAESPPSEGRPPEEAPKISAENAKEIYNKFKTELPEINSSEFVQGVQALSILGKLEQKPKGLGAKVWLMSYLRPLYAEYAPEELEDLIDDILEGYPKVMEILDGIASTANLSANWYTTTDGLLTVAKGLQSMDEKNIEVVLPKAIEVFYGHSISPKDIEVLKSTTKGEQAPSAGEGTLVEKARELYKRYLQSYFKVRLQEAVENKPIRTTASESAVRSSFETFLRHQGVSEQNRKSYAQSLTAEDVMMENKMNLYAVDFAAGALDEELLEQVESYLGIKAKDIPLEVPPDPTISLPFGELQKRGEGGLYIPSRIPRGVLEPVKIIYFTIEGQEGEIRLKRHKFQKNATYMVTAGWDQSKDQWVCTVSINLTGKPEDWEGISHAIESVKIVPSTESPEQEESQDEETSEKSPPMKGLGQALATLSPTERVARLEKAKRDIDHYKNRIAKVQGYINQNLLDLASIEQELKTEAQQPLPFTFWPRRDRYKYSKARIEPNEPETGWHIGTEPRRKGLIEALEKEKKSLLIANEDCKKSIKSDSFSIQFEEELLKSQTGENKMSIRMRIAERKEQHMIESTIKDIRNSYSALTLYRSIDWNNWHSNSTARGVVFGALVNKGQLQANTNDVTKFVNMIKRIYEIDIDPSEVIHAYNSMPVILEQYLIPQVMEDRPGWFKVAEERQEIFKELSDVGILPYTSAAYVWFNKYADGLKSTRLED